MAPTCPFVYSLAHSQLAEKAFGLCEGTNISSRCFYWTEKFLSLTYSNLCCRDGIEDFNIRICILHRAWHLIVTHSYKKVKEWNLRTECKEGHLSIDGNTLHSVVNIDKFSARNSKHWNLFHRLFNLYACEKIFDVQTSNK